MSYTKTIDSTLFSTSEGAFPFCCGCRVGFSGVYGLWDASCLAFSSSSLARSLSSSCLDLGRCANGQINHLSKLCLCNCTTVDLLNDHCHLHRLLPGRSCPLLAIGDTSTLLDPPLNKNHPSTKATLVNGTHSGLIEGGH